MPKFSGQDRKTYIHENVSLLYSKVDEYTRLLGNLFVYTEPIDAQFESHSNSSNKPFRDSTILKKIPEGI